MVGILRAISAISLSCKRYGSSCSSCSSIANGSRIIQLLIEFNRKCYERNDVGGQRLLKLFGKSKKVVNC